MNQTTQFLQLLELQPATWVRVDSTQGSTPREVGAWMAVFAKTVVGTVGGGHLEMQAIELARQRLAGSASGAGDAVVRFALGPSLGQCCGGVMHLRFDVLRAADVQNTRDWLLAWQKQHYKPLALFGGGHVGNALVRILGGLPVSVTWVDSRDEIFPADVPGNVLCEHADPVFRAVADLPPGSSVLIMSFSHAEDLDVVAACLMRLRTRGDLPYIGLIGSKTKWATFRHRLSERGFVPAELHAITSPIGLAGIDGKEPEVIAVAVAAQLLQQPG